MAHRQNLPFKKVGHLIVTRDAQPASATEPSMFVLVTGQIKTDDDQGILQFSQFFHVSISLGLPGPVSHALILEPAGNS